MAQGLLAATSDLAAGPAFSEPPPSSLPAISNRLRGPRVDSKSVSLRPLAHNFWLKAKAYVYVLQVFRLTCGVCSLVHNNPCVVHRNVCGFAHHPHTFHIPSTVLSTHCAEHLLNAETPTAHSLQTTRARLSPPNGGYVIALEIFLGALGASAV